VTSPRSTTSPKPRLFPRGLRVERPQRASRSWSAMAGSCSGRRGRSATMREKGAGRNVDVVRNCGNAETPAVVRPGERVGTAVTRRGEAAHGGVAGPPEPANRDAAEVDRRSALDAMDLRHEDDNFGLYWRSSSPSPSISTNRNGQRSPSLSSRANRRAALVLAKSFYRIIGTVIGAARGAAPGSRSFAQERVLFLGAPRGLDRPLHLRIEAFRETLPPTVSSLNWLPRSQSSEITGCARSRPTRFSLQRRASLKSRWASSWSA